jgi:hypothetical protein
MHLFLRAITMDRNSRVVCSARQNGRKEKRSNYIPTGQMHQTCEVGGGGVGGGATSGIFTSAYWVSEI